MRRVRTAIFLALLMSAGCMDTSGEVRVAPSAHHLESKIRSAAEALNGWADSDVFAVSLADDEDRKNEKVIFRAHAPEDTDVGGYTTHWMRGVSVTVRHDAPECAIAHELGHAAGLEHVSDPANLMYDGKLGEGRGCNDWQWELTDEQIEIIREAK